MNDDDEDDEKINIDEDNDDEILNDDDDDEKMNDNVDDGDVDDVFMMLFIMSYDDDHDHEVVLSI